MLHVQPMLKISFQVKTWKMHMFTGFQALGLSILWTVMRIKQISLFFPFFVVGMIPLRLSLRFLYTPKELDAVSMALQVLNRKSTVVPF